MKLFHLLQFSFSMIALTACGSEKADHFTSSDFYINYQKDEILTQEDKDLIAKHEERIRDLSTNSLDEKEIIKKARKKAYDSCSLKEWDVKGKKCNYILGEQYLK